MHRRSQSQKSIQQKALSKTFGSPEQDFEDVFEPIKPISTAVITLSALAKKLIEYNQGFDLYFRNNLLRITDILSYKKSYPKYIIEHSLSFIKMLNFAAASFIHLQDFEASMKVLDLALRLSWAGQQETSENLTQQIVVINNLAVLSQKIGKYSISKSYLKLAISKMNHISAEGNQSEQLYAVEVITLNNLCHQYMKEEKHEKVFKLSDRALQIIEPQMFQRLREEGDDVLKTDVKFISNLQLLLQAYIYRAWSLNEVQNAVYYEQKQQQLSSSSAAIESPSQDRMKIYKNGYKLSRILLGKEDKSTKQFQTLLLRELESMDGKKPPKMGTLDFGNNSNKPTSSLNRFYDIFCQDYLNLEADQKLHVLKYTLEQRDAQVEVNNNTLQVIDSQEDVGEQEQAEERQLEDNEPFLQQPFNFSQIPYFNPPMSRKILCNNNRRNSFKQSKLTQQSNQSQMLSNNQISTGKLLNAKGRAYSQFNPREQYSQAEMLLQQNGQFNQQYQMFPSLQQAQVKGTNASIINNANRNIMANKLPPNLIEQPFYQQQKQALVVPERTEQLSSQIQQQIPVLSPQTGVISAKSRFFNLGMKPTLASAENNNNSIDSLAQGAMQQQQYFINNFVNANPPPSQQQYLNQNAATQQQQILQQQPYSFGRGNLLSIQQKYGQILQNQGFGNQQEIISAGQEYSALNYPGGQHVVPAAEGDKKTETTTYLNNNNVQGVIINPANQKQQLQLLEQQKLFLMNRPEFIQPSTGAWCYPQQQIENNNSKINQRQFVSGNTNTNWNTTPEQFVGQQNQVQFSNKVMPNGAVHANPTDQSYVANLMEDTIKIDSQEQQQHKPSGQLLKNILLAQFNEASKNNNNHDESLIIPRETASENGSNSKQINIIAASNGINNQGKLVITQFATKKLENTSEDSNNESNSVKIRSEESNATVSRKDSNNNHVKIPLHLIEDKIAEVHNNDSANNNPISHKASSPQGSQGVTKQQASSKIASQQTANTTKALSPSTNPSKRVTTPAATAISSNQAEQTTKSSTKDARNSIKEQPTKDIVSLKNIPAGLIELSSDNIHHKNDHNVPQVGSDQQGSSKKPEVADNIALVSPSNQASQKQQSHKEFDHSQTIKHSQEQQQFKTQQSQQQTQIVLSGQPRVGQNHRKSRDDIIKVIIPGNNTTAITPGNIPPVVQHQTNNSKSKLPSLNSISQNTFLIVQTDPSMNKFSKFDEEDTTPHAVSKQNTYSHQHHHHHQTQPPSSVLPETNFDYLAHITPEIISNIDYASRKRIICNSIIYEVEIKVNKLQPETIIELSGYSVLERKELPMEQLTFKVLQKRLVQIVNKK